MMTFKQAEALYWIAQLGNFEAAAAKLHMSQSAISKRIQELESFFSVEIFDRSHRNAQLTEKGKELLEHIKELLDKRDTLLERLSNKEILIKHFRLGLTDLTALTWLPRLIEAIRKAYPKVQIEPVVAPTLALHNKLIHDQLDLMITPEVMDKEGLIGTLLDTVDNVWMCAPGLLPENQSAASLHNMTHYPILSQGTESGTGAYYSCWLCKQKIKFSHTITSDSILTQIGLTLSGVGISYLPRQCFAYLVAKKQLCILDAPVDLPPIRYHAYYRSDRTHGINASIAEFAKTACDFSKLLLSDVGTTNR